MTDDQAPPHAHRLLLLIPLLAFALVPWLADRRTANLMPALVACVVFGAVLMAAVFLDSVRDRSKVEWLLAVAATVGLLAGATAAASLSGTSSLDHRARGAAAIAAVLSAVLSFWHPRASLRPFLLASAVVLASLAGSVPVRGAIEHEERVDRRVDELVAAGFGTSYLPVIGGRGPTSASLSRNGLRLSYFDPDDEVGATPYVSISHGDLCEVVRAPDEDECPSPEGTVGSAGDDEFGQDLDDGTVLVLSAYSGEVVTQEQIDDVERVEGEPIRALAELVVAGDEGP